MPVSAEQKTLGLSWFLGEIIQLFFTGSKLSAGKLPLTVGADISSVTFKTKKPENPVSEQQSEMEQASHQHAPGEIQKPSSVSGVFGCWASECARIQTQQAPVCFHSHG